LIFAVFPLLIFFTIFLTGILEILRFPCIWSAVTFSPTISTPVISIAFPMLEAPDPPERSRDSVITRLSMVASSASRVSKTPLVVLVVSESVSSVVSSSVSVSSEVLVFTGGM